MPTFFVNTSDPIYKSGDPNQAGERGAAVIVKEDAQHINVGGFDWSLQFSWHGIPERDRSLRARNIDPVSRSSFADNASVKEAITVPETTPTSARIVALCSGLPRHNGYI
ncbi:hypothetical protein Q1695_016377 [Nippostrongylus brasiliensis]|nr:hypothetical protein Q1695_016377 [Nippostrongylus brasiliensis]